MEPLLKFPPFPSKETLLELFKSPYGFLVSLCSLIIFTILLRKTNPSSQQKKKQKPAGGGAATRPRELQEYTKAEVARHTGEDDLWLIIKSKGGDGRYKVYDVTKYIEHHPGGDAIFAHAGADCTEGFNGIQHPPTVYDLVEEYHIGYVSDM